MKITAVIMAGGRGERFWPKSRMDCPKQFLAFAGHEKTMLQQAAGRLEPLVDPQDIYVVANQDYRGLINSQLPHIPEENILAEPLAKNTAPCIGLAAAVIQKKYGDAVMLVLPADHLIADIDQFAKTLKQAAQLAAESGNLMTVGITPTCPETGYGYIQCGPLQPAPGPLPVYKVGRFVEKPDYETAKAYLTSGDYLWNSGIFIWKASAILLQMQQLLPRLYEGLQQIQSAFATPDYQAVLKRCYDRIEPVSIDYGILEHTADIFTIPGSFGWDDAGSWLVLERISKPDDRGNVLLGDVTAIASKNLIVMGDKRLIATVGVNDLIVVDTDDALLICHKNSSQDIKKVLENLKVAGRTSLL